MASKSLDGVLVKKANQQESFTEQQIQDLIKCMDPNTGYLYFMENYYHIRHPTKGGVLMEPYDYQYKMLDAFHNHRNVVTMIFRQGGKCVLENTNILLLNNKTGEKREISIGDFFKMQKSVTE